MEKRTHCFQISHRGQQSQNKRYENLQIIYSWNPYLNEITEMAHKCRILTNANGVVDQLWISVHKECDASFQTLPWSCQSLYSDLKTLTFRLMNEVE